MDVLIKELIENVTGAPVSEAVLAMATADIKFNRIKFGKRTSLLEAIKIAAACAGTLAKCG
ncbi:MAG: hypothetical protein N2376_07535 [Clostridia bacterium]|nr:hypothetical protein [Clostridia bacterium]